MSDHAGIITRDTYRYAFAKWRADRIVVVMSEHGVVDVAIGESDDEILREVHRRFPHIRFEPDCGARAGWVRSVIARLERPSSGVCVPLDLGGSGTSRLSPCA